MIVYWLARFFGFALRKLPLRVGYALATAIGNLTFQAWRVVHREKYEGLLDNMRHVLGSEASPAQVRELACQSLCNYCKYLADFFRFPLLKAEEVERSVVFAGWDNVNQALAAGKGVIFIGMHMGNWDMGGAALGIRNYPVNVIIERFRPEPLNQLVQGHRRRMGMKIIPMENCARALLRALRQNEMICLLIDRPAAGEGVMVKFFGGPVSVPVGAAVLALRTGARVVPAAIVRLPDNRFLALLDQGIDYQPLGHYQSDIQVLTQQIVSSLEGMIRRYPDQWYMFRRLWTQSAG